MDLQSVSKQMLKTLALTRINGMDALQPVETVKEALKHKHRIMIFFFLIKRQNLTKLSHIS